MTRFRYGKFRQAVALVLLAGCACVIGCSQKPTAVEEPASKPAKTVVPLPAAKKADTTELMEKGSGMYSRTTVYGGPTGETVVEMRIVYENGDTGKAIFRPEDGTLAETIEHYSESKLLKSTAKFAADGKTVLSGKVFDKDGKPSFGVERDPTGSLRFDRYWIDGGYVFISETIDSTGAGTRFIYRDAKTKWAVVTLVAGPPEIQVPRSKIKHSVFLRDDETPSHKIIYGDNGFEVEWFGEDGKTPTHRQYWTHGRSSALLPGGLTKVDEFESDGVTLKRRVHLSGNTGATEVPTRVELFAKGKVVSVRHFNEKLPNDPTIIAIESLTHPQSPQFKEEHGVMEKPVEREEFLNADGTVRETKAYAWDEDAAEADKVFEKVAPQTMRQPRYPLLDFMSQQVVNGRSLMQEVQTIKGDHVREWYQQALSGR